eukprot:644497-Alexandrium_andersonii.AAC.1
MRLVHDLHDEHADHTWLWELHPGRGGPRADEYVTAVRSRLGAPITDQPVECTRCGVQMDR